MVCGERGPFVIRLLRLEAGPRDGFDRGPGLARISFVAERHRLTWGADAHLGDPCRRCSTYDRVLHLIGSTGETFPDPGNSSGTL